MISSGNIKRVKGYRRTVFTYRQNLINSLLTIVQTPHTFGAKVHGKTYVASICILSKELHDKSQCSAVFDNWIPHYDNTTARPTSALCDLSVHKDLMYPVRRCLMLNLQEAETVTYGCRQCDFWRKQIFRNLGIHNSTSSSVAVTSTIAYWIQFNLQFL